MADLVLTCNASNCFKKLQEEALVTSCSHIFCTDHGQRFFKNGKVHASCSICNTKFVNQFDVYQVNLNPTDKFKSIMLSGLNPEQILDIAGRAISFFTYQLNLESQIKDNQLKNIRRQQEEANISITTSYKADIMKMQRFADSLSAELEEKMREVEMHKDRITHLSRENKQLQSKVESCRREMIFQRTTTPSSSQNMYVGTPSSYDNYFSELDSTYSRKRNQSNDQLF